MLRKIAEDGQLSAQGGSDEPLIDTIDVYLGNLHISPISRLWNTQTTQLGMTKPKEEVKKKEDDDDDQESDDENERGRGRKLKLKKDAKEEKKSMQNQIIDFESIHTLKWDRNLLKIK
jgi:hypothetical protein